MVKEWVRRAKPITRNQVAQVEAAWAIQFPEDNIECVLENSGRSPDPDVFDLGDSAEVFHPESPTFILNNFEWIQDRLVAGVYPFADDPFGNMICFDYRLFIA